MAEKTPPTQGHDDNQPDPRLAALIGLIVILVLAIGAVVLVRELGKASKLQDCLMSGRTNCAPLEVPSRQ
jgi:hypothetical protein